MNSTEENTMLNLGLKLGENLKKFRLQRELTQEQLAERAGIHVNTIRKYELGYRKPKIAQLKNCLLYTSDAADE